MPRPENLEATLAKLEENTLQFFGRNADYTPFKAEFLRQWEIEKAKLLTMDWDIEVAEIPMRYMPSTLLYSGYIGGSICNCCGSVVLKELETPRVGRINLRLGKEDPHAELYIDGVNFYYLEA